MLDDHLQLFFFVSPLMTPIRVLHLTHSILLSVVDCWAPRDLGNIGSGGGCRQGWCLGFEHEIPFRA
jgi:hypothetical protein